MKTMPMGTCCAVCGINLNWSKGYPVINTRNQQVYYYLCKDCMDRARGVCGNSFPISAADLKVKLGIEPTPVSNEVVVGQLARQNVIKKF